MLRKEPAGVATGLVVLEVFATSRRFRTRREQAIDMMPRKRLLVEKIRCIGNVISTATYYEAVKGPRSYHKHLSQHHFIAR